MRKEYQIGAAALAILALLVSVFALAESGKSDIEAMGLHPGSSSTLSGAFTADDLTALDDLTVTDDSVLTDDVDIGGSLNVGSDNLYPLGYASDAKQVVCGSTGVFTASTAVDLSGSLTAIDFAVVAQVTAVNATGTFIHFTAPTTTTLEIISLEADYTAGTSGVTAQYCVVGDQ